MHYTDFPDAPAKGAVLCNLADIPADGFFSGSVGGFLFVAVQSEQGPIVYVNACPHQFLPLDQRGPEVRGADGQTLLCTNHNAAFDLETGEGTKGFGLGCRLTPVPVEDLDGQLVVV